MKIKIAIVILIVACIALGVGLFATKKQGEEVHQTDVVTITGFSNNLVEANGELNDLRQANISLTNDLALSRAQVEQLSNNLASALATINETKTALASADDEITNLNVHVSDLELQNKVLDQRAAELTNTIAQMDEVISNTQNRLALVETNSAYLQTELQKQMAQKAELEHKFNDLNEVRTQVAKLKEEIFIARRLRMAQYDNGGKKGAELLMTRTPPTPTNAPLATMPVNYDLNVEVGSDGSVKVIPPLSATNSAPPGQ